jgi:hypothetical protein
MIAMLLDTHEAGDLPLETAHTVKPRPLVTKNELLAKSGTRTIQGQHVLVNSVC